MVHQRIDKGLKFHITWECQTEVWQNDIQMLIDYKISLLLFSFQMSGFPCIFKLVSFSLVSGFPCILLIFLEQLHDFKLAIIIIKRHLQICSLKSYWFFSSSSMKGNNQKVHLLCLSWWEQTHRRHMGHRGSKLSKTQIIAVSSTLLV